jgi:addiction module RelE/StbE family toxin
LVEVIYDPIFKKKFLKIKDRLHKDKIIKQIKKLKNNPELGKPMRYSRKGTRELYIKPYRVSYSYDSGNLIILFLDIYHKDNQ